MPFYNRTLCNYYLYASCHLKSYQRFDLLPRMRRIATSLIVRFGDLKIPAPIQTGFSSEVWRFGFLMLRVTSSLFTVLSFDELAKGVR